MTPSARPSSGPGTSTARPSSTSANPPPSRSSTTRSRPPASTPWPTAPSPSAGRATASPIIDDDLGKSGQSIEGRPGFQRLLAEVALDHVGLILGLEMSRLARSCNRTGTSCWSCAPASASCWPTPTALYDPTDHNDRLLLGLHGMMSEAELHVLKERMYQGKLNKARRGELLGMPADRLRPARLGRVGDRPRRAGPGRRPADLRPVRPRGHAARPAPLPGPPRDPHPGPARTAARTGASWSGGGRTGRRCQNLLHHPIYAGAYRFGHRPVDPRRKQPGPADHRQADPPAGGVPGADPRPAAGVHHLGPVPRPTRSGSTANRARHDRPGAPRQGPVAAGRAAAVRAVRAADDRAVLGAEGPPLLQLHPRVGRLRRAALPEPVAGRCSTSWSPGRSWRPSSRRRWRRAWRRWPRSSGSGPSWPGTGSCGGSGPRYEAERAARQYQACEPENRLVARELERRWEEALKAAAAARGRVRAVAADGPRPALGRRRAGDPVAGRRPAGGVAGGDDHARRAAADRPAA